MPGGTRSQAISQTEVMMLTNSKDMQIIIFEDKFYLHGTCN